MSEPRDRIFYNKIMNKSAIKQLIGRLIAYRGSVYTAHILDQIKTLGFQRSTQIGFSLGIDDLLSSPLKTWIIQDAEHEGIISQKHNRHGCIHAVERLRQTVETWHTTSEFLKREMTISFNMLDSFNPVHMMSFSGARGNTSQVHQLVGMRGLMSDPQGNIIDLPIQNNLREGLSLTEYIISCYGARKGVVDTAIRTADAGYLTRRLVEVAQHLVIRNVDCGTPWGVYLRSIRARQGTFNFWSQNRLVGRVLARPVCLEKRCLASRNQDINANLANHLIATYTQNILVRSPLACKNTEWACQLCYGWGGNSNKMVELGEAVGVIAGQSIGEPGTQLTLRTFHTGGVFTGDIANQIRAPLNGIIYFDSKACRSTRNRHGRLSWKCFQDLVIVIEGQNTNHTLTIPAHSLLLINNNQYVESKQVIAEVRATVAPLKETVQRHIYSHSQGEVMHTRSAWCLSTALDNNCHFNNSNNVHLWVWSGQMSEIGGYKIFSVFQSEDYIEINTPVNQQNPFHSLESGFNTNKTTLKSLLVGSFSYFRQIKNRHTGTIRIILRKKATNLCNLILSRLNQFNMPFHKIKPRVQKKLFYDKTILQNTNNIYKLELINWLIFYAEYSYFTVLKKDVFYAFVKTHNLLTTNFKYHYYFIGLIGFFKYPLQYYYKYVLKTDKKFFLTNYNITSSYVYKHTLQKSLFCKIINEHKIVYCLSFFNTSLLYAQFSNTIDFNIFSYLNRLPQLGQLIWNNIFFERTGRILESGKIVCILKQNITLRLIHPFLLASGAMIHVNCYDIIHEGDMLITLMYEQLKTSDIVQGLPKAEQLLEARSMNEIVLKLENDFLSLTECITRQLPNLCKTYNINTRNTLKHSQLELVNRIQTVYLSQGVRILDKHIEIIVRQMSSKVMLIENANLLAISFGGLICLPIPHMSAFVSHNWIEIPIQYAIDNYAFLPGEVIELARAQKMHYVLENPIAHRPMLLGITKASLTTKSFLAEASFQRTARVLSKSALQGRVDWIQGLQENILFGGMIPAGTGCEKIFSKLSFVNEVIKEQYDPFIFFTNKLTNIHNSSQTRNLGLQVFGNSNKKIADEKVKHYLVSKFVQQLFQYSSSKSVYDL